MTATLFDLALYDRIVEFVRSETRTRKPLSRDTDIAKDLGVDGDDAHDFMRRYQREFEVDLSQFEFDRHFGGEGFDLIEALKSALGRGKKRTPVTISLLFTAAKDHRWPGESAD